MSIESLAPATSREPCDVAKTFAAAAALMDEALRHSTAINERDRKTVIYWALATHALPHVSTFPLLVLIGKMGTGKSQTLSIVANFAYCPNLLSLRGMTPATIRDRFAECHEGTAVVEEADCAWNDKDMAFERMLSDRYQRGSAEASHKVPAGENKWDTVIKRYFGATVLHRRLPFVDAALDGRTVPVRLRPNHDRQYREFSAADSWNAEGKGLIGGLTFDPPDVEQPKGVAARVFNSYRILLSTAKFCDDFEFEQALLPQLLRQTEELKEAQSSEPDGLVLRAIVESVFCDGVPKFGNIKFSDIAHLVWNNHRFSLQPRQIGPIARELGFSTKTSHGRTVVVPTPAILLRACDDCEYTDEAVEELRSQMGNAGAIAS
ncbi:MAG: hypothetical protein ACLQMO_05790 [Acidobacteriaceae bacterium]